MKKIDLLILNNCPAFYKINLYNELAKYCSIHVIFLALTNQVVITDDFKKQIAFPYTVLEEIQIEKRNKRKCFFKLYSLCKSIIYKKIIIGGYGDSIEFFLLPFLLPKFRNVLQCESTIYEYKFTGIKGIIKKMLYSRYAVVLPTGKPSADIFTKINFKGTILETKGVGFFEKSSGNLPIYSKTRKNLRFIYVGRLISKKNISLLIKEFNENAYPLTIVGNGELEIELKSRAKSNISFLGFIPNNELGKIYSVHDVFILPSFVEQWGLVVEEAIYWGLPVIVSEAVGSKIDMVQKPQTGIIFKLSEKNSLHSAILEMISNYTFYKQNVLNFDFDSRDREQLNAYLKVINL